MAKRDFYEVLGLSRGAAADEIRKAHRKLVRQYHPDVNKNNAAATEKFKEVQEAYDVLSDAAKRQNYDQFGHAGVGGQPGGHAGGGDPFEAFRRAQAGRGGAAWQAGPNVSVEDFDVGGGNYGDIFEQLFGGRGGPTAGRAAGRGRARPEARRGQDLEHALTLTFEQAARGAAIPLQIHQNGRVETIEVKIPPGVKEGSRVRLKGRGHPGPAGNGDLFIITNVASHRYFRRDGLDVVLDVPVSLYEALLGAKIEVPTLGGKVTITIPPGTSGGAKLRLPGRGVERGEQKGDQLCVIRIKVPRQLDDSDKQLIQKLVEKYPVPARADVDW